MSNPISAWTPLAAADLNPAADLLVVIDVSAGALGSKTMTPAQFLQAAAGTTNCIIGYGAGAAKTTLDNCCAFGVAALNKATSASDDTAVGDVALRDATTASGCTAVGSAAALQVTTGHGNTAVGSAALGGCKTGAANTAVGQNAQGTSAAAQTECTAIGANAMYSDTADDNTGVGAYALYSKAAGANNVAIGAGAGRYLADGSTPVTAAANSTYLGRNTRAGSATTDSYSIVIGCLANGLGANTTVIGRTTATVAAMYGAHLLYNVAAPSDVADSCHIYSADVAGAACPHIRIEGGATIKLFQGTAIADATSEADAVTKLNLLLAHARARGDIAT
jgi:hypothetical protein